MYKTTNLQINQLYTFYSIKNIFLIVLYDFKIIKPPSPVPGSKCPVTILLLKRHYENKLLRVRNNKEINIIFLRNKK